MPNTALPFAGVVVFLCLLCHTAVSRSEPSEGNFMEDEDRGRLVFGNAVILKGGRAYMTTDEADGCALDVTCILPHSTHQNRSLYFQIDSELYDSTRSEVTVLNETAVKLVMSFHSLREPAWLQCKPGGPTVILYANRGLESARQYANCRARLPPVSLSTLSSSAPVLCDLTIDFGIEESLFKYNVTIGTSKDDEELVLTETTQAMPIDLVFEKLNLGSLLNASTLFIRTSLTEQFSERNKVMYSEFAIVDILELPLDFLSWDPLENGTGFRVFLNHNYLDRKCGAWQYLVDINIGNADNPRHDATSTWHMRCALCNSTCHMVLDRLRPATTFPVTLRQWIVPSGEHGHKDHQKANKTIAHLLNVTTAELAPLNGPEISDVVIKCIDATTTCNESLDINHCFVVKVSWQPLPTELLRGHLTGYAVVVSRGNITNLTETYNVPPNTLHAPDLCWDGSDQLNVSVAVKTAKGLSPFRVQVIAQMSTKALSVSSVGNHQGVSTPVVVSVLVAAGLIPIAVTVACIKFVQYRKSWKNNRLRIPRIAPSIPSLTGKEEGRDVGSSYVKLSAISSEDLNKLVQYSSDCTQLSERRRPSTIHYVRRSLSYTDFLNQQDYHLDTPERSNDDNCMDKGRRPDGDRYYGTHSAEELFRYLTNVSECSLNDCTTNCISPVSLQQLMASSNNETDAAAVASRECLTVYPGYPRGESRSQSLSLLDRRCGVRVVTSSYQQLSVSSDEPSEHSNHLVKGRSSGLLTYHDDIIECPYIDNLLERANVLTDSSGDYIRSSVPTYDNAKRDGVSTCTTLSPESDYIMAI